MKKVKIIVILIFFLAFISFVPTIGRYVGNEIRNYYLSSKNFYFNSDKLETGGIVYQIENWSGVDSYDVTYNLNSYKNNTIFSETDITYELTYKCSDNVTCTINKTEGVIEKDKHTDSFTITVTPIKALNDGEKASIEVEVKSTSPYKKTLKGKFNVVVGKMGLSYEILDETNSTYYEVAVTNTLDYYIARQAFRNYQVGEKIDMGTYQAFTEIEKSYCASAIVQINFDPNNSLLDMTSTAYLNSLNTSEVVLDSHSYINSLSFKVEPLSSYKVKFYKVDPTKDYSYPSNLESIVEVLFD